MSGNSADRKKQRKLLDGVLLALAKLGYSPHQSAVWYDRNIIWGPVGIVLVVVAGVKHDLRFLLWFAWLCSLQISREVSRSFSPTSRRYFVGTTLALIFSVALLWLNCWLRPPYYGDGISFDTNMYSGVYQEGTDIAGIKWEDQFTDVRLFIDNKLTVPVEQIDLLITVDTELAAMAQSDTYVPGVTLKPSMSGGFIRLNGTQNGRPVAVSPEYKGPVMTNTYELTCPRLAAKGRMDLVIATIALVIKRSPLGVPTTVNTEKRAPKFIKVSGTYETGAVEGAVRYSVSYAHQFETDGPATSSVSSRRSQT